jgi:hypothetical protein
MMTYFDTLKDKNVKALFAVLAPELFQMEGSMTRKQFIDSLSFEERTEVFTVVHRCMQAIGLPGWEKPMLLNREEPLCQEADA